MKVKTVNYSKETFDLKVNELIKQMEGEGHKIINVSISLISGGGHMYGCVNYHPLDELRENIVDDLME